VSGPRGSLQTTGTGTGTGAVTAAVEAEVEGLRGVAGASASLIER
jgi:hypothetical protein